MADTKTTALTALTVPVETDILYVVDNPGGTPLSKKITFANSRKLLDSENLVFGTGGDATIDYDGSDMIIDPMVVGSGRLLIGDDSAGPAILSEASGTSNPTLIPDRTELGTGIGGSSNNMTFINAGSELFTVTSTAIRGSGAATPAIQNETSSATNPTLIPDRSELGSGIGGTSNNVSIVAVGVDMMTSSSTGTVFNDGEVDLDFRVAALSEEYGFILNAAYFGGNGAVAFGSNVTTAASAKFGSVPGTIGAGANYYRLLVEADGAVTTAGSGTQAVIASLNVGEPLITIGTAAVTVASTIVIAGAPTEGTNNYALLVDAGDVRFDDTLASGTAAGPALLSETSSATNPTVVPDRTELGSGIGGTGNEVSIIAEGSEVITVADAAVGFFGVAPQTKQAHIVDADGNLADITTKFNTLLADLEGYGLLATS